MVRATMSVEPPAGNGTTKRTGRLGQSCAEAAVGQAAAKATAAMAAAITRQLDIEKLLVMFALSCRREAPRHLAIIKIGKTVRSPAPAIEERQGGSIR